LKIGAFAASHHVSIDTIRHYIDLGLLLPEKNSGQYSFDGRCANDLEEINSLKAMGFTLAEIHTVFMFRKLGRMTSYKQDASFHDLFVNKHIRISELLNELKQISSRLEAKIKEFDSTQKEKPLRLGIQLRNLGLLQCPHCKCGLNLRKAQIEDNQVMEGLLDCSCGSEFMITDGILIVKTDAGDDVSDVLVEALDQNQISNYIQNTDEAYLKNVYKSLEWAYRRLNFVELDGKVLLELGSGLGFFLRLIYDELPENTFYIAVDHDICMQRYLKQLLEKSGKRKNILFICSDFLQIPIRDKAAELVLDITGTSNYSFEHEEFLLKPVLRYFNDQAALLGSYILFGNFSTSSRVAVGLRKNFKIEMIKKEISALGFDIDNEMITDYLDKGGKYESWFTEGERVNSCVIYAKRSGVHEV
jgi:DNA-binding transcriptional MerR regulator